MQIGPVRVAPALVLAPMSGVTGSAFRRLIKRENPGCVGLVVSEFISVEALSRNNRRSLEMCRFSDEEKPIAIQIFGYDIDRMVTGARLAEESGADIVDINCGCPVPKVVKRGGGCELMRQSAHLARMLTAVRRSLTVPLTVKIRAGWDDGTRNAAEIARIAEECGVSMIAIHGRTCKQAYKGTVDWDIVRSVVESVKVPVVPSGDICSPESAFLARQAGAAALMIGRGALLNPWIFSEIELSGEKRQARKRTEVDVADVIEKYLVLLREELPDKAVIGRLKQFICQVTKGLRGGAAVRRDLCTTPGLPDFMEQLARWSDTVRSRTKMGPESLLWAGGSVDA